ncbi:kinase-like domain-containing protein [Mycena olivaceomarginata]|nr:kinase-like domain-containing protein [Mycena olivaceomarginata]
MSNLSFPLCHLSLLYEVESDPAAPIVLRSTVAMHSILPRVEETGPFGAGCLFQLYRKLVQFFCASQHAGTLRQDTQYAHPFAAGATSDVYQGRLLVRNKQPLRVAIKIVKYPADRALRRFEREATIWSQLCHANLVPLLGFVVERNILTNPKANRSQIVLAIASGLKCLHEHNIVHGDLKPGNVLIDEGGIPLICDFGISKTLDEHGFTTYSVGTLSYMAPELFIVVSQGAPQPQRDSGTTKESDVYSFSLLAFEILTSQSPKERPRTIFITLEMESNLHAERMAYHEHLKERLWEILDPCLDFQPTGRPCICDVLDGLELTLA